MAGRQTASAYCAERGGQYDVYSISVNGGPETQLKVEGMNLRPDSIIRLDDYQYLLSRQLNCTLTMS